MNIKQAFLIIILLIAANLVALIIGCYLLPGPTQLNVVNNALDDRESRHVSDISSSSKMAVNEKTSSKRRMKHHQDKIHAVDPIRYDKISSLLVSSFGAVHQLPSIPEKRRMRPGVYGNYTIPKDAVTNLTYFLQSRLRDDEEERPLYLYNPSLSPLALDNGSFVDNLIDGHLQSEAMYIATYRVSNFGNCHGPGRGVPDTYRNYLGIALLDKDLNILQNGAESYDAVIDLNAQLFGTKRGRIQQFLQDCQIYTAARNNSDGRDKLLLLQCNEYVMPIRVQIITEGDLETPTERNEITLKNHYGTKLQLSVLQKPHSITRNGKNMHHLGSGYIETWPSGPHEWIQVDFSSNPFHNSQTIKSPGIEPEPSFTTLDKNLIDRDSGSACCVPIQWSDDYGERQLLLGFSHRKTRKAPKKDSYNYVSRLYAFEPAPPFNIVAKSGFFCLGFANNNPDDAEAKGSKNEQLFGSTNEYKLSINNEVYDCPRIHFVTGIIEKIDDDETVIVSYGVNDCYPRMLEVKKEYLVDLLKGEGLS